jgi:hypothetical protein
MCKAQCVAVRAAFVISLLKTALETKQHHVQLNVLGFSVQRRDSSHLIEMNGAY